MTALFIPKTFSFDRAILASIFSFPYKKKILPHEVTSTGHKNYKLVFQYILIYL